jgi:hypothetical protein
MKKEEIRMVVQKKDPKPNSKEYKFSTVEEMFSFLNSENVDRFLEDFSIGVKAGVLMKEISNSIEKESITELKELTWIDD